MPISTDMLAAFVKVAEHLSVSAAAAELDVGKGVVSKRVGQLESAVKATLFSRSTRRMTLTPAGEAYLEFARRALSEVAGAEERLRDLRTDLTGQIRLTAPVSWGQHVLAAALPEFLVQHPALEVELLLADRVMDVAHERIDIALRWTTLHVPELVATEVARVGWVVAAAPAYLRTAGSPAHPCELARHACLCYWRESSDDAWVFAPADGGAPRQPVRVRGRYHANNAETVAEAALRGLGIALLPDYLCAAALDDGRLVRVLPQWTPHTRFGDRIVALTTPERARMARNRMLLEFLRRRLAPAQPAA